MSKDPRVFMEPDDMALVLETLTAPPVPSEVIAQALEFAKEYNPDEPRDDHGRWTSGGAGGDPAVSVLSSKSAIFAKDGGQISGPILNSDEVPAVAEISNAEGVLNGMAEIMPSSWTASSGVVMTRDALQGGPETNTLVAYSEGGQGVAGALSYELRSYDAPGDTRMYITFVGSTGIVDGTGSALVSEAVKVAADSGASIELTPFGTGAEAFWTKVGMNPSSNAENQWGATTERVKAMAARL